MYCKYDVFSVVLDSDHSEAVRENGVKGRLHSHSVNVRRRFWTRPFVLVFPAVKSQTNGEGAVRVDLGAQLLGRVFDVGQRLEGRGPGGGVDNLHQGPDGLVNQCQCHHQA